MFWGWLYGHTHAEIWGEGSHAMLCFITAVWVIHSMKYPVLVLAALSLS